MTDWPDRNESGELSGFDVVDRLRWLLRLRWLIVPIFVAVDLANDLLMGRPGAWTAIAAGAGLLVANAIYSALLSRRELLPFLVPWVRLESAIVVAVPVVMVVLHGDPNNALRYGVLVGVVGAAAVLPRTGEVTVVAVWAIAALVIGDAVVMRFDPARLGPAIVARWGMDAGIIATVAAIAGYLHAARDGTARRLAEARRALERARGEWEAAFDGVREMVFVTDADGRVVRANRAFAKLLGARPHELGGRRLSELLAGHPERWWSQPGHAVVELDDPLFDTTFEITSTRDGDRTVRVARDVGEMRRLWARLVQADKLAAVGALASGVANEVNNPAAFVSSNLTEMRRYLATYEAFVGEVTELAVRCGEADRVRSLLARPEVAFARREMPGAIADSLQGMDRVRQIASSLRSVARQDQPGEPAVPVDLADVVRAVVRTASADLRAAAVRVDAPAPAWVLGHRGELVEVVLNLVVNAIQSRQEGRPNQITLDLRQEGPSAVVRVADTGRGISPAHLKRLFEPFFTTKAPGEGTGLGLSLARRIVLSHGGAIDVSTEVGAGSTFTVRLPALEPDAAAAARRSDVA